MVTVNSYDLFAKFYDRLNYNEFSIQVVQYTDDILATLGFEGIRILDLACGTGTAAIWFAEQGYDVTAVDSSDSMIQTAKQKARRLKIKVDFQKMDMRKMEFSNQFDLAICFFDSLNHLFKYTDFEKVIRNVSRSLKPNGKFLFDMITPYKLSTQWNHSIRHENNGNLSLILTSEYKHKTHTAQITGRFLIRKGNRVQQYVRQFRNKAYTRIEIKRALAKAGLQLIHAYECFSFDKPDAKSDRIFYVAQKTRN